MQGFFAHSFAYTVSSQGLVYWQSLWQIRLGVCEIWNFEKWGAIQPLKYSSNNLSWSHISNPTWPRNFRFVLFKSPWLDSVPRNTSGKVKVLFTICSPQLGFFVCLFSPFPKPSNIPSVHKKTETGCARVLARISCCMGMWTQKHHHCSISLTSRRLILTPQLFPGILTHSIHSHWSHRDTNTEPLWKLQRETHSRSEPASAQAEGHTHTPTTEGLPRTRAGEFQSDLTPF